jgi:hypothetical protein
MLSSVLDWWDDVNLAVEPTEVEPVGDRDGDPGPTFVQHLDTPTGAVRRGAEPPTPKSLRRTPGARLRH